MNRQQRRSKEGKRIAELIEMKKNAARSDPHDWDDEGYCTKCRLGPWDALPNDILQRCSPKVSQP